MKILLTCEHGGNQIPAIYKDLFLKAGNILNSHRGYDPGAIDLFFHLEELADFSIYSTTSRLLIELNRSIGHPQLFSEITKPLSKEVKREIASGYYFPYRELVEEQIAEWLKAGERVIHLSVHTFTPELNGVIRNADIGILYDPDKSAEKKRAKIIKAALNEVDRNLVVRHNYPYKGKADGFTTYLRKKFPEGYSGIELEVNQKFVENRVMESRISKNLVMVIKAFK